MPHLEQLLLGTRLVAGGWSTKQCQGYNNLVWLMELAETTAWRGMALGHDRYVYFPLTIPK